MNPSTEKAKDYLAAIGVQTTKAMANFRKLSFSADALERDSLEQYAQNNGTATETKTLNLLSQNACV